MSDSLEHSAKGSTWKKHKYLKKIGRLYYYNKKSHEYWKDALDREEDAYGIAQSKGMSDYAGESYRDGVSKENYDKAIKDRDLFLKRSSNYGNMSLNEAEKMFGKTGGKILNSLISKYADVKVKNESDKTKEKRREKQKDLDREGLMAKKKYSYIHTKDGKYYHSYSPDRGGK